jgi:hypothetical protein
MNPNKFNASSGSSRDGEFTGETSESLFQEENSGPKC